MKTLLATIALILTFILAPLAPASAAPITGDMFPACIHEDGSGQDSACFWDAQDRGNGQGQSIVIHEDDSITEVPSLVAPVVAPVATLEAQAWGMWDAVGAASLLPADVATEVHFVGYNTTGFPFLEANHITVWDNAGNHYLFQF